MVRGYSEQTLKTEPVVQLAILTGLDADLSFIRNNREKVLPVITGVILYRQLNRLDQRKVLEQAQALENPKFFGKVQMLIAQSIAKPCGTLGVYQMVSCASISILIRQSQTSFLHGLSPSILNLRSALQQLLYTGYQKVKGLH